MWQRGGKSRVSVVHSPSTYMYQTYKPGATLVVNLGFYYRSVEKHVISIELEGCDLLLYCCSTLRVF